MDSGNIIDDNPSQGPSLYSRGWVFYLNKFNEYIMNASEINKLEVRFKSTALMLIDLDLMDGEIDELMTLASIFFDDSRYDIVCDMLDSVGVKVLEILEQ